MKIYISCDMEGVAGICTWEQVDSRGGGPEYAIGRRWMTREVAAAVDGAKDAGATDILINDSHGAMHNLELDDLPDEVRVISGNRKPLSMVQDVDETFDGAFFLGYHGAVGDANAVLSHTYTPSVVRDVHLNGIRCSEATLNAAFLGHVGVPLLLITGDRTTVESAQAQIPGVHGVIVKESIGNFSANSITPAAAQKRIREAARAVVAQGRTQDRQRVFRVDSPVTLDLEVMKVEQADVIELIPGIERTGSRSIRFVHDDYPTVFKAFVAAFRLGAA